MPQMTRLPILALALAALAAPALAQDAQTDNEEAPAQEAQTQGEEAAPAEQAPQTEGEAGTEGGDGQGGTGGLAAADGAALGNVSVSATPSGHALVLINAEGFGEGIYGAHLHQVGACEGPTFESAGPHIGEEGQHGVLTEGGPHPGDLPNAHVGPDGQLAMEAVAIGLDLGTVFDEDGSALVVHANPDDYRTQPGGNSGDRIACAVIEPAAGTMADETVDAGEAQPEDEPQATDEAQQEEETGEATEAQEQTGEEPEGQEAEEDAGN